MIYFTADLHLGHNAIIGMQDRPFETVEQMNKALIDNYNAVLWAVGKNITKGTSSTTFGPNDGCTRGQVVTFLHRFENAPTPASSTNPFEDVSSSEYYYTPVLWAVGKGITNGTDATHFSPNDTCTRGQIVTFLYRDMK